MRKQKILDEFFMMCPNITEQMFLLYERKEVTEYDCKINQKISQFEGLINNTEIQEQFKKLCIELQELNNARDCEACKLLAVHGMKFYMQLQNEILTY